MTEQERIAKGLSWIDRFTLRIINEHWLWSFEMTENEQRASARLRKKALVRQNWIGIWVPTPLGKQAHKAIRSQKP